MLSKPSYATVDSCSLLVLYSSLEVTSLEICEVPIHGGSPRVLAVGYLTVKGGSSPNTESL